MTETFPSDRTEYLELLRAEIPRYDELQEASIAAIPFEPRNVLELGFGTGETTRRLLHRFPAARVTGLDSDPAMIYAAGELGIEARLARMEDPLPDGPWDLVIAVLAVHHLPPERKRDLFRRVREQSRSLVLGDVVKHEPELTPADAGIDFFDTASEQAEWCGGKIFWEADDLAVVRAGYR